VPPREPEPDPKPDQESVPEAEAEANELHRVPQSPSGVP
jgi:hypothetical protein